MSWSSGARWWVGFYVVDLFRWVDGVGDESVSSTGMEARAKRHRGSGLAPSLFE